MVKRRQLTEAVIGVLLGALAIAAIVTCVNSFLPHQEKYPYIPVVDAIRVPSGSYAPGADDTPGSRITSIPVLSWHQMDNGCEPTAARCTTKGYSADNVTQRQFYDQISWLYTHGYRTITSEQYVAWATHKQVMLPAKPVLLTVDDGIANFYAGATPVLQHFGYTMVSMVVSGFAQGAQDGLRANKGWDATWTQLSSLPSNTWEFAFHAGPHGHTLSDSGCPFYACQRAGESVAAYKARVASDIDAGVAAEERNLGARINSQMWAVPYNDLAQDPDQPQSGATPREWLNNYAASRFSVVFVDGFTSRANQHYRYEVHGTDSLADFAAQVQRPDVYTVYPSPATATAPQGGQS
jgi:Polysaccharide deacetylase